MGEDGSITIFSLFVFFMILIFAGMAVDLMRHDTRRVNLQNAMDSAVLAASGTPKDVDPKTVAEDFLEKSGIDLDQVTIQARSNIVGNTLLSRDVQITSRTTTSTYFMGLIGIENLNSPVRARAFEGKQSIEIALVLDISGSMNDNSKLTNLKTAAKQFVSTILANSNPDNVSISIVPYNHQVYMSNALRNNLPMQNAVVEITSPPDHDGALTEYETMNSRARCARFDDADFETTRLVSGLDTYGNLAPLQPSSVFVDDTFWHQLGDDYNRYARTPHEFSFWCNDFFSQILLYQNDETTLHNHIDAIVALEGTAIDIGMNWGVGILDPSFNPVLEGMVSDTALPARVSGHPAAYNNSDVQKHIVLMTDGKNTTHFDLKPPYRSGPSRVWYSEDFGDDSGWDGYLVEMPDNPAETRWFRPGSPFDTADDRFVSASNFPEDAVQWDYHRLYNRFRTNDVANYLFRLDPFGKAEFSDVVEDTGSFGTADTKLLNVCSAAKTTRRIVVYTVAFEAPTEGQETLEACASSSGHYFDVAGTEISEAFSAIASHISQLRLTE